MQYCCSVDWSCYCTWHLIPFAKPAPKVNLCWVILYWGRGLVRVTIMAAVAWGQTNSSCFCLLSYGIRLFSRVSVVAFFFSSFLNFFFLFSFVKCKKAVHLYTFIKTIVIAQQCKMNNWCDQQLLNRFIINKYFAKWSCICVPVVGNWHDFTWGQKKNVLHLTFHVFNISRKLVS